jgi:cbb3-type cytochrome oxidase subunit 1
MFAAIYHILPRISGVAICPRRIKAHFWLAMPGALLLALPLLGGGIAQGLKLANPNVPFLETTKAAMMAFRLSTLGELMIAIGALLFLVNVLVVIVSYYRTVCRTAYLDATALTPLEVKS